MKILWLSHIVPYPPKGGVLQRSFNLINELAKFHDIYLVTFDQDAGIRPIEELRHAIDELGRVCEIVGIASIPCDRWKYGKYYLSVKSLFTKYPYTLNWLCSKDMGNILRRLLKEIKIDFVHFDTISLAIYRDLFVNHKKALNHHNIESHMMLRRGELEENIVQKMYFLQEGKRLKAYEKEWCPEFDVNITCSKLDSERLLTISPGIRVEEIPNGVDLDYFQPLHLEKERNSLIFAGGMGYYPNRKAMLYFADKIWPLLKNSIPDVKATIIGRHPPEKLVRMGEEDRNLVVTGYVDDVRPYIDRSMVYICPIQDGGGTKLKVLDALAMGKPIVADPVACEGIEVKEGDNVLFAKEPREYLNGIRRLFEDEPMRSRMGERAIELVVSKYSFRAIGAKLAGTYEALSRSTDIAPSIGTPL